MAQRFFAETEKAGYGHWENTDYTPHGDVRRVDQKIGTRIKQFKYALKDAPAGSEDRKNADYYQLMVNDFNKQLGDGKLSPEKRSWIEQRRDEMLAHLNKPVGILRKQYFYMPEKAARILDNYLSPGLRKDRPWFQAYLGAANVLNQAQLGLSFFHAGFTAMDTMTSKMALAFNQFAAGRISEGFKSLAEVPVSAVLTPLRGDKLVKEWYQPGSQSEQVQRIVDAAISGGWRAGQDAFYSSQMTRNMMKAFREGSIRGLTMGALRAPFAAVEQVSRPIMEWLVPRMKAGIASDLIRMEMARKPGMSYDELRKVADRVARSVDNRLGQMVYDNLHWNKVVKDLGMASVRSLGWNLGTLREMGGGAIDTAKFLTNLRKGGNPQFTYRMSYVIALPILTAAIGTMINRLMTGEYPKEIRDYFYPRTGSKDENGRDQRVSLPSYMKDVYAYSKAPLQTVQHKLHPLIGAVAEMLENEDFYGVKIRNEDDPVMKQIMSVAAHALQTFEPFASRGARQLALGGSSVGMMTAPFFGITPAPASVKKTKAENLAAEYVANNLGDKSVTPEQFETSQQKRQALNAMRKGDFGPASDALAQGKISAKDFASLSKRSVSTPLQDSFKRLNLNQAEKVYSVATEQEKESLLPLLVLKRVKAMKEHPDTAGFPSP